MSRERLEASGYIMSGEYYRIPKLLHIETYEGDLLSMLGMTREGYSHYERNSREPSLESLMRLSRLYKIDISELIKAI